MNIPRLPSQEAAIHLVSGELIGIPESIGATIIRATIISAGMYIAGYRGRDLARASLYGATAVEIFVIGYTAYFARQSNA